MRILAVDDEPGILRVCERLLAAAGHSVESCGDGAAACARLSEGWDLVLSDLAMSGGVAGEEVLRRGRRSGAEVVLMTAYPDTGSALCALEEGACGYLLKPFGREDLLAVVGRCEERLARQKRERDLRAQFSRFADPEVVRYALEHSEDSLARGERALAAVLFADVRGFTPFAERVGPERAMLLLNEALGLVVQAVRREGGLVNKFVGDGLMAVFGAPSPRADRVEAAARSALSARAAVETLSTMRRALGHEHLRLGFGIGSGVVVAGCLGTRERAEYTVIGPAANLAARLVAAAAPGQILADARTARALPPSFSTRAQPPLTLPGLGLVAACEVGAG